MALQKPLIISNSAKPAASYSNKLLGAMWVLALYAAFGFIVLIIGLLSGMSYDDPMVTATIIGFLIVVPVMWYRPSIGAYIVMTGAAVFETFPLGFPDSIFDQTVFFQAFRSAGGPGFMLFNAAEMILGFSLLTIILHRIAAREKPLELGSMFWAVAFYTVMVVFGLLHGIATGGNFTAALWEARGQFYILLAYLIVVNTFDSKAQINRLMWFFIIGIALKGLVGSWRFFVTLGGSLDNMALLSRNSNSFLAHEESYFFALMIIFGYILFMFRSHRGQLFFIILMTAPVMLSFLVNQRRIGTLVLGAGIVLVTYLAFYLVKSRRKLILSGVIIGAMLMPGYIAATWNTDSFIGQPTRAIRSVIDPSARDDASNSYRDIENMDLIWNIQIDPIQGRGYGKEIIFFIPLPEISSLFFWWDIIPHNTILWVWMRLGFLGFAAFWFLVGRSISGSIMITKHLSDPYLQSVGVFAVAGLVTWVFMGFLDMGLVDFRETMLIGILIGVATILTKADDKLKEEKSDKDEDDADAPISAPTGKQVPRILV